MQTIDKSFWKRFAKTTWEKKSVTIKSIRSPLLELDQKVIFDLLVKYSNRCRRLKNAEGMKLYVDGHRQFESEVLRHLPKKSDRSFAGYHDRMSSQYSDYCLVCDELLQVDHDKHENLTEFLAELFSEVGMPNRFAEMGLYLGNYRKTPFGVHEDPCGVFSFPVVGKKKFRVWEPAVVKHNPKLAQAFSYGKYKAASQVLEARVGDMTYWPSSAWHIAESDGTFSATWSLGVWVDKKHGDVVSEVTSDIFKKILGDLANATMTHFDSSQHARGEVLALPLSYEKTVKVLSSVSRKALTTGFRKSWLEHLSKSGLKNFPPIDFKLSSKSQLKLKNLNRPIHWMPDGSANIIAFNGIALRSTSKSLLKFVVELNEGKRSKPNPKDFLEIKSLADAGAFALVKHGRVRG